MLFSEFIPMSPLGWHMLALEELIFGVALFAKWGLRLHRSARRLLAASWTSDYESRENTIEEGPIEPEDFRAHLEGF